MTSHAPRLLAALALVAFTAGAAAKDKADTVIEGFSASRLAGLGEKLRADVKSGRLPGAVLLISRNGKLVHSDVIGVQDPNSSAPMRKDSIFRIYSMTKPFVSVAVMMLVEEGRLQISEPVSKYIPELKDLKVGVEKAGDGGVRLELVPAAREITIQDLLRHTSGFTYGVFGKSLVKDEYNKLGIDSWDQTNAEVMKKLAMAPLQFQPGTMWEYSRSVDVLGHLLERISGQPLDQYLQERIFKPLGMKDTGFWVAPPKQDRIAEAFEIDPDSKARVALIEVRKAPKLLSGGGGGVSTARDYLRFAQMLINGGELDGVRILSKKTVEYMMSDHLGAIRPASLARGAAYLPGPGYGFGLGFAVRTETGEATTPGTVGDANWGGLGGTYFWVDPKEKLAVVWMAQGPGQRTYFRQVIRTGVYGAMVK
jgi:CubicO group peptidase (beta-lactamase class C family)